MQAGKNVKEEGKDNNLLELIAADPRVQSDVRAAAGNHGAVQVCWTRTGTGGCIPCKRCKSGIGEESGRTRRKGGDQRIIEKWLKNRQSTVVLWPVFLWNCPNKHIMFALISNIIRRPHRGISDGNADGNSFEKNVSISSSRMFASDSVSLPRLNTPGVCPPNQRQ